MAPSMDGTQVAARRQAETEDQPLQEYANLFVSKLTKDVVNDDEMEDQPHDVEVDFCDDEDEYLVEEPAGSMDQVAARGDNKVVEPPVASTAFNGSVLMQCVENGELIEALKGASKPETKVSGLKSTIFNKLLGGAKNGTLLNALREVNQEKTTQEKTAQEKTAQDILKNEQTENNEIRSQVLSVMLDGLRKGTLGKALGRVSQQRMAKAKEEEEQQLKGEARDALIAGARSGRLAEVLAALPRPTPPTQRAEEDLSETSVEQFRLEARQCLLEGARSGRLEHVVKDVLRKRSNDEEEKLKVQLRTTLVDSARNGALSDALKSLRPKPAKEDEQERTRRLVMEALVQGARSGKLREALQSVQPHAKSEEEQAASSTEMEDAEEDVESSAVDDEDYEEVMSLASDDALSDEELEVLAIGYVHTAFKEAKSAMDTELSQESEFARGRAEEEERQPHVTESLEAMEAAIEASPSAMSPPSFNSGAYFSEHFGNAFSGFPGLYAKFSQSPAKTKEAASEAPPPAMSPTPFNMGAYYSEHFGMTSSAFAGLYAKFSQSPAKTKEAASEAPPPTMTPPPFNMGAYYSEHFGMASSALSGLYVKFSRPTSAPEETPTPAPAVPAAVAAQAPSLLEPSALASHRPAPLLELASSPLASSPKTVPRTKRKVISNLACSPESKMSLLTKLEAEPLPIPTSPGKLGQLKELRRNSSVTRLRGSSPAGPLRPRLKESITAFRMDLDDEIEEVVQPSSLVRKSSLTTAFDALGGAEFHHMAAGDSDTETMVQRPASHTKSLGQLIVPGTPKTRSSVSRSKSSSAMALDLGLGETSRSEFLRAATPGLGMPVRPQMPKSSSLGSLNKVVKSRPAPGLLPQLSAASLGKPMSDLSAKAVKHHKGNRVWSGSASTMIL